MGVSVTGNEKKKEKENVTGANGAMKMDTECQEPTTSVKGNLP